MPQAARERVTARDHLKPLAFAFTHMRLAHVVAASSLIAKPTIASRLAGGRAIIANRLHLDVSPGVEPGHLVGALPRQHLEK
jgi:hypothetical protein